jgi:UDP-N-acetyl-D-mannosaminuronic acid dehydrogenase
VQKAADDFQERIGRAPVIACLGLAFKPNIDDLRESPAIEIAERLKQLGHNPLVVEPNIKTHPSLELCSLDEALERADIIAFLVGHQEFAHRTPPSAKIIMDFCGITKS